MLKFLVPAIALAFAPLPALAGVEGTETYIQDDFDIAGVTLGMQPNDVLTALEGKGYKMRPKGSGYQSTVGPSFDEMVLIANGEMDKNSARDSWSEMVFDKGTNEGISVKFKPLPTGVAASQVYYYNMSPGMTAERMLAAAERKYGRAPFVSNSGGRAHWSNMKLIGGDSFDVDAGAIELVSKNGPPQNGSAAFQQVKGSLKLIGGKVGQADPEAIAKDWTGEPETTF